MSESNVASPGTEPDGNVDGPSPTLASDSANVEIPARPPPPVPLSKAFLDKASNGAASERVHNTGRDGGNSITTPTTNYATSTAASNSTTSYNDSSDHSNADDEPSISPPLPRHRPVIDHIASRLGRHQRRAVSSMRESMKLQAEERRTRVELARSHSHVIKMMREQMQKDYQYTQALANEGAEQGSNGSSSTSPPSSIKARERETDEPTSMNALLGGSFLVTEEWNWLSYHERYVHVNKFVFALLNQLLLPLWATGWWLQLEVGATGRMSPEQKVECRAIAADVVAWVCTVLAAILYSTHSNDNLVFFQYELGPLTVAWLLVVFNYCYLGGLSDIGEAHRSPQLRSLKRMLLPEHTSAIRRPRRMSTTQYRRNVTVSDVSRAMAGTRLDSMYFLVSHEPSKQINSTMSFDDGTLGMGKMSAYNDMEGVYSATDVTNEVLVRSRYRSRNMTYKVVTVTFALLYSLTLHICRLTVKSDRLSSIDAPQAVTMVASFIASVHYNLLLVRMLHLVLSTYMERKHVNKYLGAMLDDTQADWFQLPHIELQDPHTCAFNVMAWIQMRFVLLRISNRAIQRSGMFLSTVFLVDLLLVVTVILNALILKQFTSALVVMIGAVAIITLYLMQILERSGMSNTEQTSHFKQLAKAEFVLRQHQLVMPQSDRQREQYDLASRTLHAIAVYLEYNDDLTVIFGVQADSNMTSRIIIFMITALFAVTLELLLAV